ncbi:hypothetical protein [Azospirillum cavernae]|uniref:hypothetical protein n=1 Tax=Azospirillum cavernae TaxID=2320860 RepID=UPI0011C45597|nr:hypothetical protein [Azospirillum cavernae]
MNGLVDHGSNLRYSANLSSAIITLQRNRVLAQNPHNGDMATIDVERERRRSALIQFWETNRHALKSIRQWAEASKVGYNTLNEFIRRKKDKNMLADTYEKLARGASILLSRDVTIHELLNEEAFDEKSEATQRIERIALLISHLPDHEQEAFEVVLQGRVQALGKS